MAIRAGVNAVPFREADRLVVHLIEFEPFSSRGRVLSPGNRSRRVIPKVDFSRGLCCACVMATVHIVDDDESIRLALDSLFRSVGLATHLYGSTKDFLKADL